MALGEYEELAARAFDEPYEGELREAVRVCADALEQLEDPRGPLIAMEHALHDANHAEAIALRKLMHEHAAGVGAGLLGPAVSLMYAGRTLALEWRAGRIYGISIDARYVPEKTRSTHGALVKQVLRAPAAHDLRRLRVRIRHVDEIRSILEELTHEPPPLEQLELYTDVWPAALGGDAVPFVGSPLLFHKTLTRVYYAVEGVRVQALSPEPGATTAQLVRAVARVEAPTTPEARAFLGRALTFGDEGLRLAALARIVQLGAQARVFEHVLCALLQPAVASRAIEGRSSRPLLPIVEALVAIGPSRGARCVLAKVASRPEYYEPEVRRAAGKASAQDRR